MNDARRKPKERGGVIARGIRGSPIGGEMGHHHRLMLAVVLASLAYAQADRGTLTGTVADPHGALIPAAQIRVRHPETGAQYETVTTSTGNYSLAQLPAGTYEVTVESPGFKKYDAAIPRGVFQRFQSACSRQSEFG